VCGEKKNCSILINMDEGGRLGEDIYTHTNTHGGDAAAIRVARCDFLPLCRTPRDTFLHPSLHPLICAQSAHGMSAECAADSAH
jgi:hypothetical protein